MVDLQGPASEDSVKQSIARSAFSFAGVDLEPRSNSTMPGTCPSPASAEAKATVSTLSRCPRRHLIVGRVRRSMNGGTVMVGVVPVFDESCRGALSRLIALWCAERLSSDDRGSEKKGGEDDCDNSIGGFERHCAELPDESDAASPGSSCRRHSMFL
jgi:hypothetical protein